MYNPKDPQSLEKYSSAVTLSDMEIFIFPELLYSLILANIMSPRLWLWKNDSWFTKLNSMNDYRKIQRLKQYIMDHFNFNLDLDTWGLTTKQRELARFSAFIEESTLSQSNALFGYEGDKYYFDIDIRKHFGLDKYTSDIIPYWKTETLEAMEAFKYKPGYMTGAGECVSLSTLYAAAIHVVAGISLDDIYCIATPLHSQNFVDIKEGIVTNNRRIVTKTMWFNGTELSAKARRAIMHERITVVTHNSGYIHTVYPEATISPDAFRTFSELLTNFCKTDINFEIMAGFLRERSKLQRCFQIAHRCCGKPRYIEAEKVFSYEHSSKSRVGDQTQDSLLHEIDEDEFYPEALPNRLILNELEDFFKTNHISIDCDCNIDELNRQLSHTCLQMQNVITDLIQFCKIAPQLPDAASKKFLPSQTINLDSCKSANDVADYLHSIRGTNAFADLAFTAFRDMSRSPWRPFIKAALERNPVCISAVKSMTISDIAQRLAAMDNQSIYAEEYRIAQPDEVWNFARGDGLEKALTLVSIFKNREPEHITTLDGDGKKVVVRHNKQEHLFNSNKQVPLPVAGDFLL